MSVVAPDVSSLQSPASSSSRMSRLIHNISALRGFERLRIRALTCGRTLKVGELRIHVQMDSSVLGLEVFNATLGLHDEHYTIDVNIPEAMARSHDTRKG